MSITVTNGTWAAATGTNQSVTPTIPGSSSATSILLALFVTRGASTMAETGAGTWTEIYDEQPGTAQTVAAYWAAGTETTAPTVQGTGTTNPIQGVVMRLEGADTTTPVGTIGTGFSVTVLDSGNVGPIADPTPLTSTNGVIVCLATHRFTGDTVATSSSISSNSSGGGGSWVKGADGFVTTGNDMSSSYWTYIFTSAPTMADETATFSGGTASAGQVGKMLEIVAAAATTNIPAVTNLRRTMDVI